MNIWAVGRNYLDHAKEMGQKNPAAEPMIFLKAGPCIVRNGGQVHLPRWSQNVAHEVEVAVRLGKNLGPEAFTVALDLTARDIQDKLKAASHPWTIAKSFIDSCPLGDFVPLKSLEQFSELEFFIEVDGQRRQHGFTKDMIFSLERLIGFIKERLPVREGDLLLTGTPAGVAQLLPGDSVHAEIVGFTKAKWELV